MPLLPCRRFFSGAFAANDCRQEKAVKNHRPATSSGQAVQRASLKKISVHQCPSVVKTSFSASDPKPQTPALSRLPTKFSFFFIFLANAPKYPAYYLVRRHFFVAVFAEKMNFQLDFVKKRRILRL